MECAPNTPVCRGCLAADGPLRNMFDVCLHDHYAAITNVQVLRSEGLPELLCAACEAKLLECRRFRARCQRSDALLRSTAAVKATSPIKLKPAQLIAEAKRKVNCGNDTIKESTVTFVCTDEKLTLFITPKDADSNGDADLVCPYSCKNVFARRNHLLAHLVRQHGADEAKFTIESQYYCHHASCPYSLDSGKNKYFTAKKILKNHIVNIHKTKDIVCDKCDERFATESAFNRHRVVCSERYVCAVCDIEYKTNERLLVHLMRKHPDLHKEYKRQRKQLKERSKMSHKRLTDEVQTNAKRSKSEVNSDRSTQTSSKEKAKDIETQTKKKTSEFIFDCSPKRTFATQTFELRAVECVKNDISLGSCVAHSPQSLKYSTPLPTEKISNYELNDVFSLEERVNSSTIETQTVFEDLLSIRSQNSEDEIFETVSLSDIQTQTWPVEFGLSSPVKKTTCETQTNPLTKSNGTEFSRGLASSPDLSFKETQTCFCFLDSPKPNSSHFNFPKSIFESATSSPVNCMTSTETQTAEDSASRLRKDVMLSFHSIETQTGDESSLDSAKLGL